MIVLDTHAWIWWAAEPKRLSRAARAAIEKEPTRGVCAISVWEVAMLVERGRLTLDRKIGAWVEQALDLPGVEVLALTPEISLEAARSPLAHGDPADRMIAATALVHRARLVTKDARLGEMKGLQTVW